MTTGEDALDREIAAGFALPVVGWDASPVRGRWLDRGPPWSYDRRARALLHHVRSALDLGTGGGERLASFAPLPPRVYATEGYPPNLSIARRRLRPLGVVVVPTGPDLRLPFPERSVDLVLDRHEAFDAREVRRVLVPGGTFLTQQVGGRNYVELARWFGVDPEPPTNRVGSARALASEISSAGLTIVEVREARYEARFLDLAALIWFLRFAPWEVPGFSAHRDRAALARRHRVLRRQGALRLTAHRLLVVARRPPDPGPVGPGRNLSKKRFHTRSV